MNDINNNSLVEIDLHARFKFHQEFFEILSNHDNILKNIWILNEIVFPFKNDHKKQPVKFADLLKYAPPLNDYSYYTNQKRLNRNFLEHEYKPLSPKKLTHTLIALNKDGKLSSPLIIFPKNELIPDMKDHNLNESTCIEETQHGQLNDLNLFFKWLRVFVCAQKRQCDHKGIFVLLISSFLRSILFNEESQLKAEINSFCEREKVVFLFYPVDNKMDIFNRNIFEAFKEEWEEMWTHCVRRRNPNSQVTFVMAFKQVWRILCSSNFLVNDCFDEVFGLRKQKEFVYGLNAKIDNEYNDQINPSSSSASPEDGTKLLDESNESIEYVEDEIEDEIEDLDLKLSEQEIVDLARWIDDLSIIGSTCITKSFLKELDLRQSNSSHNLNTSRRLNEKDWEDFSIKNRNKFKQETSFGLTNEIDYLNKWQNIDFCRTAYLKYAKNICNIQSSKQLWTVEFFYFPYSNQKIQDIKIREFEEAGTSTSAISVIFAYNASGDNMEPYFVFPLELRNTSTNSTKFLFTKTGQIDSQVFELWLTTFFLPYATEVNKEKINLILYKSRLPIINQNVTKLCNSSESKLKLFGITREELIPANFLFSKTIRSRKINLLKSSWKKTIYNFGSSQDLKCPSTEGFFNLFIDYFVDIMEEINKSDDYFTGNGNEDLHTSKFELKMIKSFCYCKFWPIV